MLWNPQQVIAVAALTLAVGAGVSCFLRTPPAQVGSTTITSKGPESSPRERLTSEHQRFLDFIKQEDTTVSLRLEEINARQLRTANRMKLELPSREVVSIERQEVRSRSRESYTWYGSINTSETSGRAILVVQGEHVTGTLRIADQFYTIKPLGTGLHAVIETNQKAYDKCGVKPNYGTAGQSPMPPFWTPEDGGRGPFICLEPDEIPTDRTVRVLVAYTPAAAVQTLDIYSEIQLAIDETNVSYENSEAVPRLELALVVPVDYTESGSTGTGLDTSLDLSRFSQMGDGFMDEVHTLRDTYAADVALLIVGNAEHGGIASTILATPGTAFALVKRSNLENLSLAHEVGHLQGADHDPDHEPRADPVFEFGHAYWEKNENWKTLMSGSPRLAYWSNPEVGHPDSGTPMGTWHTHNNVCVLNITAGTVAGFKAGPCIPGACNPEVIVLPQGQANRDQFGFSVAIDGDFAVVGAPHDDELGEDAGAVYIYRRTGTTWFLAQRATASDAASHDWFGKAVAISGPYLIVGAPGDDPSGDRSGSVYFFEQGPHHWDELSKVSLENNGAPFDQFGQTVGVFTTGGQDAQAIVGAPGHDGNGTETGAAFVYVRVPQPNRPARWVMEAQLTASDGSQQDSFGRAVAIRLERAIIGAPNADTGYAYVFRRIVARWPEVEVSWTEEGKLVPHDGAIDDHFGMSVALGRKDRALIGSPGHDGAGQNAGAAYLFSLGVDLVNSQFIWVQNEKLTASDVTTDAAFGWSVSMDGDLAIVGAPEGDGAVGESGAAYTFFYTPIGSTWIEDRKLLPSDARSGSAFGRSVGISGKAGIVGTPFYGDIATGPGGAFIYDPLFPP